MTATSTPSESRSEARIGGSLRDGVEGVVGHAGDVVRVDADGAGDVGVRGGEGEGVVDVGERGAGADDDEVDHAGLARALHHGEARLLGGAEVGELEVAVAVDDLHIEGFSGAG